MNTMMRTAVVALKIMVAALFLFAAGCAPDTAAHLRTTPFPRYSPGDTGLTLKPGDKIDIVIHNPEVQQFKEVIDINGFVTLPHIGQVKVAGMACSEAERAIRREYVTQKIYKEGAIQVAIVPPASEFFVEGQVNKPGSYQFTRDITVLQAVGMAGGPNEFADRRKRKLIRGAVTIEIDIDKIKIGDQKDPPVQPGDRIIVPRGWY